MHVTELRPGDVTELKRVAGVQRGAVHRGKYRAVVQAMGGREAPDVAHALGRSRRAVQGWVHAYRDDEMDALMPGRSTGRPTKLPKDYEALFPARLAGGPTDADGGVCTLRRLNAVRILATEFQAWCTLDGEYDLLQRLGYSCLIVGQSPLGLEPAFSRRRGPRATRTRSAPRPRLGTPRPTGHGDRSGRRGAAARFDGRSSPRPG